MNLGLAIAIAANGFKKKKDKGGKPYILHCLWVMFNLNTKDEELQSIAVLHDCIEDNVCTMEDLMKYGFSERVIYAVMLLTHDPYTSYEDYIKLIATNKDATAVKLSDLEHNTNVTRLKDPLTKSSFARIEKYHRAFVYLSKI